MAGSSLRRVQMSAGTIPHVARLLTFSLLQKLLADDIVK